MPVPDIPIPVVHFEEEFFGYAFWCETPYPGAHSYELRYSYNYGMIDTLPVLGERPTISSGDLDPTQSYYVQARARITYYEGNTLLLSDWGEWSTPGQFQVGTDIYKPLTVSPPLLYTETYEDTAFKLAPKDYPFSVLLEHKTYPTMSIDIYTSKKTEMMASYKGVGGGDWIAIGGTVEPGTDEDGQSHILKSNEDNVADIFIATKSSVWGEGYYAVHTGCINIDWAGTGESISLAGKNRFLDIILGSNQDSNALLLTDDANGDAIFLDDVYSASVKLGTDGGRLEQIREIRAGAGDDVIDLTSDKFSFNCSWDISIFGGDGNDVIWANGKSSHLFGDAGNDKMVGTSGMDDFIGGSGNDIMYGVGGDDTFIFGGNFGHDIVQQNELDGWVTLWFESGSMANWNAETLTYTDGNNSVTVQGVDNEHINFLFGNDVDEWQMEKYNTLVEMKAFADYASCKVYEDDAKIDSGTIVAIKL